VVYYVCKGGNNSLHFQCWPYGYAGYSHSYLYAVYGWLYIHFKKRLDEMPNYEIQIKNPIDITASLKFALILTITFLSLKWVKNMQTNMAYWLYLSFRYC